MKPIVGKAEFSSKNFWMRLLTGVVLVLVITSSIMYSRYSFTLVVLFINLSGLNEFYTLLRVSNLKKYFGLVLSAILFITSTLAITQLFLKESIVISVPVAFILFLLVLYDRSEKPFMELAITFLGIIYITIPCILLVLLAFSFPYNGVYNRYTILGLFFMVWANDSGAYITGKLLGEHALFKRISPAKTWEGWIGGSVSTLSVAGLLVYYFTDIGYIHWIAMAFIVIVIGPFGDLVKSRLKRSLNVKDSGRLLPGHGGVLDRFDSLLSSSSLILSYVIILQFF